MGFMSDIWDAIEDSIVDAFYNYIVNPITSTINATITSIENFFLDNIFYPIQNFFIDNIYNPIVGGVTDIINQINDFINLVLILFYCVMALFNFISAICVYIGAFVSWLFIYFLPWIGQYLQCAFQKILYLPKCMFWYMLDTVMFTLGVPFRFLFWLISIEDVVDDYLWNPLEKLDKYIHDSGPNNLGTGFHIIHFPDSAIEKCYNCKIQPIGKKMPSTCELTKKYSAFINCRNPQSPNKCKSKISQYFDSPSNAIKSSSIDSTTDIQLTETKLREKNADLTRDNNSVTEK